MADLQKLQTAFMRAHQAGDTKAAAVLAAEVRRLRNAENYEAKAAKDDRIAAQQAADRERYNPTNGQSFLTNTRQGIGAGLTSVLRAIGGGVLAEKMGLPATKEEAAQIDAPLDATGGGVTGRIIGTAAPALLAVPFTPATMSGAMIAGGVTGGAMTEGGLGDRALGAGFGAGGGAVGAMVPGALRAGRGVWRGLTDPLSNAGRDRIAGRALERFAANPETGDQIAALVGSPRTSITGAQLTVPELTGDTGLAVLQRTIGTMDPAADAALAARQQANNSARTNTLRQIAGDPGARAPSSRVRRLAQIADGSRTRAQAEGTRSAAATRSYGAADDAGIDPAVAEMMRPQMDELLSRPSIQASMEQARNLAREAGINIDQVAGNVQGLHFLKKALDDIVDGAVPGSNTQRLTAQTSRDLASTLDEIAPLYQAARQEFAQNSVPINRMDVAQRLLDTTARARRDFSGDRRMQANAFAKALNDEGALIGKATDFDGYQSLADLMSPAQTQRIGAIRNELEMLANLGEAANGPGSQTAKMLASQNMLRQVAGPLGVPDRFLEGSLADTLMAGPNAAYRFLGANERVGSTVQRALMDPGEAARVLAAARARDVARPRSQLDLLTRRSVPAGIGGLTAYGTGQ